VRVLIDGRLVNAATFENTGFEGALDALIACSKGEAGWWGAGVGGEPPAKTPAAEPQLRYNKEDVWAIYVSDEPNICVAQAEADGGFALQLLAGDGALMLGIASAEPMPKNRAVRVETDTYSFTFSPKYSEQDRYLNSHDVLDSQAVFALRRAKGVRVSIGRKILFDANLESTGYPAILEDVLACSHGEKGWWNEPAPAS
jgi:hypothetical protein